MKKFVFELQDILDIRKFEQQQAESELAKALAEENRIQSELNALAAKKVSVSKSIKGSSNFSDIANASNFFDFVRTRSESLLEELTKAKLVSDEKRNLLKKVMQKTDALQQLKDSQYKEYKAEVKRTEMKEINDIVTSRFNI